MPQSKPKIIYWKAGAAVRAPQVYLDANFIVALNRPGHIWHITAGGLLETFGQRQTKMILSALALNEAIYQLLRLRQKDEEAENSAREEQETPPPSEDSSRKTDRDFAARLDTTLLDLPNLHPFEPVSPSFHRQMLKAIQDLGLDPTDAFHYTAARHLNCPLVTNDAGFQKIQDGNLTILTFF